MKTLANSINERLVEIQDAHRRKQLGEVVTPYVSTGLKTWDAEGGLLRGILTVIGAATGEGKSIVKLQLARAAAKDLNRVLMIDFEDPIAKTADRAFSQITGIDNKKIGLYKLEDKHVQQLIGASKEAGEWASSIRHMQGLLSVSVCLEAMAESDADLILVDYAQAFPEDDDKTMERTIADFALQANRLAQSKNCAIVVFSQLVREVEQRGYRAFERTRFRNPDSFDVSGFCPSGLTDIAWAKALGERCKELDYLWRPGRVAQRLGAKVEDNRMRIIRAKANFGSEFDLVFSFDGPTATVGDL